MKALKLILLALAVATLSNCSSSEANLDKSQIKSKSFKFEIVCDSYNNAYYVYGRSLSPVLKNRRYGAYIVSCSDIAK